MFIIVDKISKFVYYNQHYKQELIAASLKTNNCFTLGSKRGCDHLHLFFNKNFPVTSNPGIFVKIKIHTVFYPDTGIIINLSMSFGRFEIKTRPLKMAFLVDEQNQSDIIKAIEISSYQWGGYFNPIVPYFENIPDHWQDQANGYTSLRLIQNYLGLFDPDLIVSVGRISVSEELKKAFPDIEFIDADKLMEDVDRTGMPVYGIGLFEVLKKYYQEEFKFEARHPRKVTIPIGTDGNILFISAFTGAFPDRIGKLLLESFKSLLEIEEPVLDLENYYSVLGTVFPRIMGSLYVGRITKRLEGMSQAVILVNPSNTTDILDYWNLRANGWKIFPVPVTEVLSQELKQIILGFIDENYREIPFSINVHSRTTLLKGRSVSMDQFEKFKQQLAGFDSQGKYEIADKVYVQHWMPRMWIDWAEKSDHLSCCEVESLAHTINFNEIPEQIRFDVLTPSFFIKDRMRYSEALFANEVEYNFYGVSKLIGEVIPWKLQRFANNYIFWRFDVRASKSNVTYLPANVYSSLYFELPDARTILKKWFKQAGFQTTDSYTGPIAEQMLLKLGGGHGIIHTIQRKGFIELLEKFSGGKSLSYPAVLGELKKMKNESEFVYSENEALDNILEKNILELGLEIQCPVCKQRNWYHMDRLGYELECAHCLSSFKSPVSRPKEMQFSYKAKGTFSLPSQAYGSYTVLLTHYFFTAALNYPSTASFGIILKRGNYEYEIDYVLYGKERKAGFEETVTILAECKTFASFLVDDIQRMETLGKMFPGSVLLFSTLKSDLTGNEKNLIRSLIKKNKESADRQQPHNRILILTGHELRNYGRPPHSWSDELKARDTSINYDNLYSLDSLCRATQILHIGSL